MVNLIVTLLLPILVLNTVMRAVQVFCNEEMRDKNIPVIIITTFQIVGLVVIGMVFNKLSLNLFLYLIILSIVVFNFLQSAIDSKLVRINVSTIGSGFLVWLLSSLVSIGVYYYIFV